MKAAILVAQREPLVVDEVAIPALNWGQVLVRVHYSGVCGSQLGEIDGVKGADKYLPHLLGHEGGGVVVEIGAGVRCVKPGDRVVLHWRPGAGLTASPPTYEWRGKPLNAGWVTTFNEMAVVSENRVTPIPADVDLKVAALYGCAITTGFGVVANEAAVKLGESVVVFGAGGVGSAVVLGARLAGANPIVAIDLKHSKLDAAKKFGATHVLDGSESGLAERIRAIVGGAGADVVIENTGAGKVIEMAYGLCSGRGRLVLVGVPRFDERVALDTMPLHFGRVMTGSHGGHSDPSVDIPRYLGLERAGRFELGGMISHEFELDDINEAIETLRSGDALRCLIRI